MAWLKGWSIWRFGTVLSVWRVEGFVGFEVLGGFEGFGGFERFGGFPLAQKLVPHHQLHMKILCMKLTNSGGQSGISFGQFFIKKNGFGFKNMKVEK